MNRQKCLQVIAILLFSFTYSIGFAQEIDNQLWINYAVTVPLNKHFSYGGDAGLRGLISNEDWNQVLIRPTVTYRFKYPISVAAAVAWFGTFNVEEYNVNEFRIHQDFNLKWPDFGFMQLFYRIRLEERFFFYEEDIQDDFKVRLRGLIGIETQDFTWFGKKRPIYFQGIYEVFKTLNDDEAVEVFINQARVHFAFGHRISKKFRYELHYIRQSSRLFSDEGLNTSQNIFRIRLYHRIQKD